MAGRGAVPTLSGSASGIESYQTNVHPPNTLPRWPDGGCHCPLQVGDALSQVPLSTSLPHVMKLGEASHFTGGETGAWSVQLLAHTTHDHGHYLAQTLSSAVQLAGDSHFPFLPRKESLGPMSPGRSQP